jgi:hypothetical protein
MAVNETRNMNQDLREGITDGMVKKSTPDRGGDLFDGHCADGVRAALSRELYDPVVGRNPAQAYAGARVASLSEHA